MLYNLITTHNRGHITDKKINKRGSLLCAYFLCLPNNNNLTSFVDLSPSCFKDFSIFLLREAASFSSTLWLQHNIVVVYISSSWLNKIHPNSVVGHFSFDFPRRATLLLDTEPNWHSYQNPVKTSLFSRWGGQNNLAVNHLQSRISKKVTYCIYL